LTNGLNAASFHRSPLTAHRSPLTAHRSPLTAHRSPLTAHRSPLTVPLKVEDILPLPAYEATLVALSLYV